MSNTRYIVKYTWKFKDGEYVFGKSSSFESRENAYERFDHICEQPEEYLYDESCEILEASIKTITTTVEKHLF